jgi:Autotransporter beta-domain
MTEFGDFVSVDSEENARGYGFATGGVSLGIDFRVTDFLAIGAMSENSHTWTTWTLVAISMSTAAGVGYTPPYLATGFTSIAASTAAITTTIRVVRVSSELLMAAPKGGVERLRLSFWTPDHWPDRRVAI